MANFPYDFNFFDATDALILDTALGALENVTGRKKHKKTMDEIIYEKYGVTRDDPRFDALRMGLTHKNATM